MWFLIDLYKGGLIIADKKKWSTSGLKPSFELKV